MLIYDNVSKKMSREIDFFLLFLIVFKLLCMPSFKSIAVLYEERSVAWVIPPLSLAIRRLKYVGEN